MKLVKIDYSIRCEVGGCGRLAKYRMQTGEEGVHTGIHLCEHCAKESMKALKNAFYKGQKE